MLTGLAINKSYTPGSLLPISLTKNTIDEPWFGSTPIQPWYG